MLEENIIKATKNWIREVVIGCNFCPFAARELRKDSIVYIVVNDEDSEGCLSKLKDAFSMLDREPGIETILLIVPKGFDAFDNYLELLDEAQQVLENDDYEGVYQVASFHPEYLFAGTDPDDPANYTNRSPYPMIHLLREESVSKAIDSYPDTEMIPEKNIDFAQKKGLAYMRALRMACMNNLD